VDAADAPASAGWWAKVTLEYDGTHFAGSQAQPAQRTVQGEVEAALMRLTGEWRRIVLAGRTDAGVHAAGQVASFVAPARFTPERLRGGLNALLPEDVAAVAVEKVAAGFHARFAAVSRRYAYDIWNGPARSPLRRATAWHVRPPLAVEAMHDAGQALLGEHDFASFAGAGRGVPGDDGGASGTRRTLTTLAVAVAEATATGRLVRLTIEAPSFLPHMVRNIAGALVEVGLGRWPVERPAVVLAAMDRRQSAATAPPQGVNLLAVTYGQTWYDRTELDHTDGR
jgi:tRNA pseudouridine38-40 synthase